MVSQSQQQHRTWYGQLVMLISRLAPLKNVSHFLLFGIHIIQHVFFRLFSCYMIYFIIEYIQYFLYKIEFK